MTIIPKIKGFSLIIILLTLCSSSFGFTLNVNNTSASHFTLQLYRCNTGQANPIDIPSHSHISFADTPTSYTGCTAVYNDDWGDKLTISAQQILGQTVISVTTIMYNSNYNNSTHTLTLCKLFSACTA